MPYTLFVDDNFHYMDEDSRYKAGEFSTLEAAVAAAKAIVDDYLLSAAQSAATADALLTSYAMFGEDPFIVAEGERESGVLFSARDYARVRCAELAGRQEK